MKIAFFTETYLPHLNGVSISLVFPKKELEKKGHEVYVFAPKIAGYKDSEKNIIRLSSIRIINSEPEQKLPIPTPQFRKILNMKFDVIHGHGGGFLSLVGYQIALTKGYPFVLTYHTYLEKYTHYFFIKSKMITSPIAKNGSRFICNISDIVIVPSIKMKKILVKYGVSKKVVVVPNPVNLERFVKTKKGYLRKLLGIGEANIILLTASRLGEEKNIDFLVKSFYEVSKKDLSSVLVIAGEGQEEEKLKYLVKNLGLESRVYFPGYIDTKFMPKAYSDADIFVFASTTETQGMVVPEAASCGLPLVLVQDEAFNGVIKDDFNGYAVSEKPKLFASKVLNLILDTKKREVFGKNSAKLVREIFKQEDLIRKLENVYQEAIMIRKKEPRITSRVQNGVKKFIGLFRYIKELNRRLNELNEKTRI